MGDRIGVQLPLREIYLSLTNHPGQLSLAIPSWVGAMSTSQRAVMLCDWGVKADMVLFAGNTVWSISERVRGVCVDALYKSTFTLLYNKLTTELITICYEQVCWQSELTMNMSRDNIKWHLVAVYPYNIQSEKTVVSIWQMVQHFWLKMLLWNTTESAYKQQNLKLPSWHELVYNFLQIHTQISAIHKCGNIDGFTARGFLTY